MTFAADLSPITLYKYPQKIDFMIVSVNKVIRRYVSPQIESKDSDGAVPVHVHTLYWSSVLPKVGDANSSVYCSR